MLRRWSFVRTTDSNHQLPVYPNLAKDRTLTAVNQLWVSDITYIRLLHEFVYLAVIVDAFSRKVIGRALDQTLESDLTIEALWKAIRSGRIEWCLTSGVHPNLRCRSQRPISLVPWTQFRRAWARLVEITDALGRV